jgi:hypothetical protein
MRSTPELDPRCAVVCSEIDVYGNGLVRLLSDSGPISLGPG